MHWLGSFGLVLGSLAIAVNNAPAQRFPGETAWNTLAEHQGVVVKYLYYSRANSVADGVVMLLENTNTYRVDYRFTVVFRSEDKEAEAQVAGELDIGEMKTGDGDGLFWVPFEDGRAINQVGIRGFKITQVIDPSP